MSKIVVDKNHAKRIINMAIRAGRILLASGAEIYRAEETVVYLCSSYENITDVNAYAYPNAILVSVEFNNETLTVFKSQKGNDTNLNRISRVIDFSRRFANEDMKVEEANAILREIENEPPYSDITNLLGSILATSFFAMLFGGNLRDAFATMIVTIITTLIRSNSVVSNLPFFISNFIIAFFDSVFAVILVKLEIGHNLDPIIIGAIMLLVPGISITNAVRNMVNQDYISGTSGFLHSIFASLSIALGVGTVLNFIK